METSNSPTVTAYQGISSSSFRPVYQFVVGDGRIAAAYYKRLRFRVYWTKNVYVLVCNERTRKNEMNKTRLQHETSPRTTE